MDKEILNMEEAAELFGVSSKTFIKLLKEEKVPARKIGREWRFSRKALIDWLSAGDSQLYSASDADVREFFNEVAPEWEKISSSYYDESARDKLLEMDILKKDMAVIDLGAGDGYISRAVAPLVRKVIAVDLSSQMLKELKKKARQSGIKNIETIESDALDVPVEDSSVDLVCASMYLHHIEEPDLAVKEMARMLKPGGMVFLADFSEHGDTSMKEHMHDIWPGFKRKDIKGWFEANGFTRVHFEVIPGKGSDEAKEGAAGTTIFVLTAVKSK